MVDYCIICFQLYHISTIVNLIANLTKAQLTKHFDTVQFIYRYQIVNVYIASVTQSYWEKGNLVAVGSTQLMYGNLAITATTTIDNTLSAVWHYYFGKGKDAALGVYWTRWIFERKLPPHKSLNFPIGSFSIDMTIGVFHIGKTTIAYQKGTTYDLFICGLSDGLLDSNFISERWFNISSDGK